MNSDQKISCKECDKNAEKSEEPTPCENCQKKMVENHFSNWSCGCQRLDKYLMKKQIDIIGYQVEMPVRWIPPEEFGEITLLKRGGEGIIYFSEWSCGPLGTGSIPVALKCLYSSTDNVEKFIEEVSFLIYEFF